MPCAPWEPCVPPPPPPEGPCTPCTPCTVALVICIPRMFTTIPVVDEVAINIGLDISPLVVGVVLVRAPAVEGETKYTSPSVSPVRPFI